MILFLIRGILIGLVFGIPVGAVGALTVQRTLESGIKAGLFTGMGSSVADCIYASIGAFGLTVLSDFLLKIQNVIHCVGGCLILGMGILFLIRKPVYQEMKTESSSFWAMFFSSFAIGITNPAAILTFLLAFSWFGIAGETGIKESILLVAGVFIGTYFWWGILTFGTDMLRRKAKIWDSKRLNNLFGTILTVIGGIIIAGFFLW